VDLADEDTPRPQHHDLPVSTNSHHPDQGASATEVAFVAAFAAVSEVTSRHEAEEDSEADHHEAVSVTEVASVADAAALATSLMGLALLRTLPQLVRVEEDEVGMVLMAVIAQVEAGTKAAAAATVGMLVGLGAIWSHWAKNLGVVWLIVTATDVHRTATGIRETVDMMIETDTHGSANTRMMVTTRGASEGIERLYWTVASGNVHGAIHRATSLAPIPQLLKQLLQLCKGLRVRIACSVTPLTCSSSSFPSTAEGKLDFTDLNTPMSLLAIAADISGTKITCRMVFLCRLLHHSLGVLLLRSNDR